MEANQFQFRGNFYKQTYGVNMGNPLSCFVANVFVGKMEMDLKERGLLPKTWKRFIDDVFAIVKVNEVDIVLKTINSQHPKIKFTVEREHENKLPFLDVLLTRKNGKIEVSVYRKHTNTDRYTTNDSHCPMNTKKSANSMVYRMCNLPLSAKTI